MLPIIFALEGGILLGFETLTKVEHLGWIKLPFKYMFLQLETGTVTTNLTY